MRRAVRTPSSSVIPLLVCLLAGLAAGQYVEDSIDVGRSWVGGMVYNPAGNVIYGNCQYTNGVFFAIDCATNQVASSFTIPWPMGTAYNATMNRVYCAFERGGESYVATISGVSHQQTGEVQVPGANQLVWDSVGNRIYVSCTENNRVGVIDCATDSVVGSIRVGTGPIRMLISPARRKLYVINYDFGSVSVVDMTADTVIKTVALGGYTSAAWYDPELDRCYVGAQDDAFVISCETDTILYRIPVGAQNDATAIGGGVPGLAVIGAYPSNRLYVVSRQTGLVKTTVLGGDGPNSMTWGVGGVRMYCANSYSDDVTVLTGDGVTVLRTLPVGNYPFCFAYSPIQRWLYVGHLGGRYVYVIKDTAAGVEEVAGREAVRSALTASPSTFTSSVEFRGIGVGRVEVFDREGRIVRVLGSPGGVGASCRWDGRDERGREAPAGVYVAVLRGDAERRVKVVKVR